MSLTASEQSADCSSDSLGSHLQAELRMDTPLLVWVRHPPIV